MGKGISNLRLLKRYGVRQITRGAYKDGFVAGLRLAIKEFNKKRGCFCIGDPVFRHICYECQEWLKQEINLLRNKE